MEAEKLYQLLKKLEYDKINELRPKDLLWIFDLNNELSLFLEFLLNNINDSNLITSKERKIVQDLYLANTSTAENNESENLDVELLLLKNKTLSDENIALEKELAELEFQHRLLNNIKQKNNTMSKKEEEIFTTLKNKERMIDERINILNNKANLLVDNIVSFHEYYLKEDLDLETKFENMIKSKSVVKEMFTDQYEHLILNLKDNQEYKKIQEYEQTIAWIQDLFDKSMCHIHTSKERYQQIEANFNALKDDSFKLLNQMVDEYNRNQTRAHEKYVDYVLYNSALIKYISVSLQKRKQNKIEKAKLLRELDNGTIHFINKLENRRKNFSSPQAISQNDQKLNIESLVEKNFTSGLPSDKVFKSMEEQICKLIGEMETKIIQPDMTNSSCSTLNVISMELVDKLIEIKKSAIWLKENCIDDNDLH